MDSIDKTLITVGLLGTFLPSQKERRQARRRSERVFFWVFIFHWDFAVPSLAEVDNFKYIKWRVREKIMLIYFTFVVPIGYENILYIHSVVAVKFKISYLIFTLNQPHQHTYVHDHSVPEAILYFILQIRFNHFFEMTFSRCSKYGKY